MGKKWMQDALTGRGALNSLESVARLKRAPFVDLAALRSSWKQRPEKQATLQATHLQFLTF
jgi:hypothetical protein